MGCDFRGSLSLSAVSSFQSTHPRGVRHLYKIECSGCSRVSIHAPAWGATNGAPLWSTGYLQFQSTHPRGVRPLFGGIFLRRFGFQSTHPRGVRHQTLTDGSTVTEVSIHAPAWGATGLDLFAMKMVFWFQSTHPRGVRRDDNAFKTSSLLFQSTHPRGVRRLARVHSQASTGFQSTHPRGVRPFRAGAGASGAKRFNPRTRVGCDLSCGGDDAYPHCFNPRTRVGCDSPCAKMIARSGKFQSTHPRGVRPLQRHRSRERSMVSIHAPAWGAT